MKALITQKLGMTSAIDQDGVTSAVTLLQATPCIVTRIKSAETDGYNSVQLGFGEAKKQSVAKPQLDQYKSLKMIPKFIREFRVAEPTEDLKVGDQINPEVFSIGDVVNVTGTSKGKGWAGTIKRHNFHRQRKTHGGKGNTRKVGSIGSMYPQHIFKGKKMPGQMGYERVTVKNLKVVLIEPEHGVIGVAGAVPGPKKGLVMLKEAK